MELFVGNICPSLDVTVETEEFGNVFKVVTANDWKEIEGTALVNRIERKEYLGFDDGYNNMRDLIGDDGVIYGRAMVDTMAHGTVTIGGLSSCRIQGIRGILLGEALGSSRNAGRALVPKQVLRDWATEQAKLFMTRSGNQYWSAEVFPFLYACGAELSNFPFICGDCTSKDKDYVFSLNSFQEEVKGLISFFVCEGGDLLFEEGYDEDITPKAFEEFFLRRENVYEFPQAYAHGGDWLDKQEVEFAEFVEEILQDIVAKAWGEAPVIQESKQVIGEVEGVEVVRSVIVFSKGDFIDGVD